MKLSALVLIPVLAPVLALCQSNTGSQPASSLAVTAVSTANTAVTLTLPAVAGQFHYITSIQITRTCTSAVAGSAVLTVTTTNLPGSLAWTAGNACGVGTTNQDVGLLALDTRPLKSSVVNTATTIVAPAAGATAIYRINVLYFTGP
jgi:hypothetical protein